MPATAEREAKKRRGDALIRPGTCRTPPDRACKHQTLRASRVPQVCSSIHFLLLGAVIYATTDDESGEEEMPLEDMSSNMLAGSADVDHGIPC